MIPVGQVTRPKPGQTERAFLTARLLAVKLHIASQQMAALPVDDPAWEQVWQLASRYEAVERSTRRQTGWTRCIFGPDRTCPERLPVKCVACNGTIDEHPRYVLVTESHIETDGQGKKWLHQTLRIPASDQDPWYSIGLIEQDGAA